MQPRYSGTPPSSPSPGSSFPPPPPSGPPSAPPPGDPQSSAPAEPSIEEQIESLTAKFKSGANWFYWIAGLTLASSVLILAGSNISFAFGLGITQIIDGIALEFGPNGGLGVKAVAFIFDLVIIGLVILVGLLANQRQRWAFILGMILYALDGLLFLIVMDVIGIIVHVLVLFFFFGGLRALSQLKRLEASLMPPLAMQTASPEPRFFPPPR